MPKIDKGLVLTIGNPLSERAKSTLAHLASTGVPAEPFTGWNGGVTGMVTTHTYEVDNPGSGYVIGPKTSNMYMGHVAMWRTALHLDGDSFLFMEDDVRFVDDWRRVMQDSDHNLPADWDLVFPGSCCTQGRPKTHMSGRLWKIGFAMCAHAYIVRRKALRSMIEWCERVDSPIDVAITLQCIPRLNTFAYLPRIADQPGTEFPE